MRWLLVHRDKMQSGLQQLVLLAATHFPSGSESPRITTSMGLLAFCWTTWARVSFRKLTYLWEHREKEKKRKGKKRKEKKRKEKKRKEKKRKEKKRKEKKRLCLSASIY